MRRLLRVLLVITAILVVLAVGLLLAARAYLRSESVRRQVATRLEALYGGPVEIDGADIDLLGGSSLRGLRLYESDKAEQTPWASAGTVKTDVSALDLLRGVMPGRITLEEPVVTLRLDRDGRLLTRLPEGETTAATLPEVHVEGGQVTVRQEGRPEMVVKGVRADLRPDGGRLAVSGGVSDPYWGDWSLDGAIDRAAGTFTATLMTDRAGVTQDKLLRLPVVPPAVWKHVKAEGVTPVEFTFRHDPRARAVNHYRVVLQPDGAAITVPTLSLPANDVHGGITVEDAVVTLDNVRARAFGGTMGVDGRLDFRGKEEVFHFVVRAKGLNVADLPQEWPLDERLRHLGGRLSGTADLTVTYDGEVHTRGEGHGEIAGVMLGGKPTSIELTLEPSGKGFKLLQPPPKQGRLPGAAPQTSFALLGAGLATTILLQAPPAPTPSLARDITETITGTLQTAGRILIDAGQKAVSSIPKGDITKPAPPNKPPTYLDLSVNLKDVDLAQLLKDLKVQVPFAVSGRLTMKVQASLPVDQAADLKLYKVSGTATLPALTLAGVEMKDVKARVRYDNGVLRLEELRGQIVGGPPPAAGKPYAGSFEGSARLGVIPDGDLTADLKVTEIPLAQLLRAVGVKGEVSGAVSGSADLRVPAGRLSDLTAWRGSGKLSAERIGAYGLSLTEASLAVRLDKGLLTVRDVTGKLEGAAVSGSAEAKLTAPYTYDGQLELAKGDLASLQRLAPGLRPPVTVAGQFGITAEVNGTFSPFTAKGSGSGTGQDVKVEKVSVNRLSFRWAVDGALLKLRDVKAELYGGAVTGSADVPLSPKTAGKVDLHVDEVDVGALARDIPALKLRLEGKVGGDIKATLPAGEERAVEGEVDLATPKLRVQGLPVDKVTGTVTYRKGVGEYRLKGGLLGGTVELNGTFPPRPATPAAPPAKPQPRPEKPEPPTDSHLRIRGAQLGRLGESLGVRGLDPLHGRIDLDVDFRLQAPDFLPVGSGSLQVTRLRWGDQEITDSLRGDIVLAEGQVRLRNLSGLLGGGALRGQVALGLSDLRRSFFDLAVDAADPARVLAPWPVLAANVTGSVDARLHGALRGRHWHGGGNVVLARGKVFGVEVSEWRLPIRFDLVPARGRAQIDVDDMSAQVGRGRVNGRASFRFGDENHLEGNLRLYGADLRALLRPLTENTQLGSGLVSGRIDFAGNNVRSFDDVTATVEASFAQAQALQMPILSSLVPFLLPGQSNATFQSGEVRGRLANGIFRVERLTLSGNVVKLFAVGTVTTAGRLNLDVTATTGVLPLLGLRVPAAGPIPLGLLVRATNYLASTSIHLLVGGTVRSPVVRVEPLSLLTEEAARFFLLRAAGLP